MTKNDQLENSEDQWLVDSLWLETLSLRLQYSSKDSLSGIWQLIGVGHHQSNRRPVQVQCQDHLHQHSEPNLTAVDFPVCWIAMHCILMESARAGFQSKVCIITGIGKLSCISLVLKFKIWKHVWRRRKLRLKEKAKWKYRHIGVEITVLDGLK